MAMAHTIQMHWFVVGSLFGSGDSYSADAESVPTAMAHNPNTGLRWDPFLDPVIVPAAPICIPAGTRNGPECPPNGAPWWRPDERNTMNPNGLVSFSFSSVEHD